jgi:hypothetical protein
LFIAIQLSPRRKYKFSQNFSVIFDLWKYRAPKWSDIDKLSWTQHKQLPRNGFGNRMNISQVRMCSCDTSMLTFVKRLEPDFSASKAEQVLRKRLWILTVPALLQ